MSKSLAEKMVNIMSRVDSVFKGARIEITQSRSYNAVSHDDIAALIHPELVQEKIWTKVTVKSCDVERIAVIKKGSQGSYETVEYLAKAWVTVSFINAENPQDREDVDSFAYAIDSGDKATGKALSMAVKYVYLKNFTLESTDEEEARPDHGYQERRNEPKTTSDKDVKSAGGSQMTGPAHWKAIEEICKRKGVQKPFVKLVSEFDVEMLRLNKLPDAK